LGLPAAPPSAPAATIVEPAPTRPPSIAPDLRLARAQADHKLYDQALSTLREAINRDGESAMAVDAYFLIASIQEKQHKIDDARATYVLIGDRFRDGSRADEAMFALAQATLRSGRDDREAEAHAILGRLVERSPRGTWAVRALMARADVEERKRMHQFDEELGTVVPSALVTYRGLIARDGSFPEREHALWKAGELYERGKRYYLAARSYSTLAEQYPETGYDAWAAAGRVYEKRLKDAAQARAAYARVPPSSPSFRDARKFLER
jgi:tetratricopeptide (TPR) repeat protein